jgi:uncharacterized protein YPO0396|tara:strand:- start:4683 stop:5132 length:450 start_codon:yes stop_codon:yes gene_type:complete
MKLMHIATLQFVPLALLAAGCSDESPDAPPGDVTAQDVREQAGRTVDTAAAYADATVQEYRQAMQERIDSLNRDIQSLQDRVAGMSGEVKAEAEQAVDSLQRERDAFVERMSEIPESSAAAWSDIKAGLDRAWEDLNAARRSAMERFGG